MIERQLGPHKVFQGQLMQMIVSLFWNDDICGSDTMV